MSVRASITNEMAQAVGRIAATHPDAGLTIRWDDGDPEQSWSVELDGSVDGNVTYHVDDETGATVPSLPEVSRP